MNVIYTQQALESLSESLVFLIQEQGLSIEQVISIKNLMIDKAEKLADAVLKYQLLSSFPVFIVFVYTL